MVLVSVVLDPVLQHTVAIHGRDGTWQFDEILAAYYQMKSRPNDPIA